MRQFRIFYVVFSSVLTAVAFLSFSQINAESQISNDLSSTDEIVSFQPPAGWKNAEKASLSPSVQALVVGPATSSIPPSINLATENYPGTLEEYLKIVRSIGEKRGSNWKDLGPFDTKAGKGRLTQLDTKTEWGDIRMMHVILVKNGIVYILTAAAMKSEFPTHYKTFFSALSSLQVEPQPR